MLYTMKAGSPDIKLSILRVQDIARKIIVLYPQKSAEAKLNRYIWEHYGLSLKQMCLKILYRASFSLNNTATAVTITLTDKELDKIASLITYGNGGNLRGSKILQTALSTSY